MTQPVTELLRRRLYAAHPSLEILEDIGPFSTVSSEARPGVASLGAEDELEEALETFGCQIEQIESRRELFELAREESGIIRVILRTVMKQGNELMKNAAAALYSAMNLAPWGSADDQERFLEAWKAFCTAVGKSSKALSRAEKRHWT